MKNIDAALKIVIDEPQQENGGYTLQKNWSSRHESIYTLLSRFSYLNAFGVHELIDLFISSKLRVKSKIHKNPFVDLRESSLFDIQSLARILVINKITIDEAFLHPKYVHTLSESTANLRYCRKCMKHGFHSPLFQIDYVFRCPIHNTKLIEHCHNCNGIMPYTLSSEMFKVPYSCPHCGIFMAPVMENLKIGKSIYEKNHVERIHNAVELAEIKHQLTFSTLNISQQSHFGEHEVLSISSAVMHRHKDAFYNFIEQLIAILTHSKQNRLQISDNLCHLEKGYYEPKVTGSNHPDTGSKHKAKYKDLFIPAPSDKQYLELIPTYKSIRRYIWRHIVKEHKKCILDAARHFWWSVEGERIFNFCPIAQAFIRWRMYWEIVSVPHSLYLAPSHLPYLLLTWLSEAAPIIQKNWSDYTKRWINNRVFALDCIRSFSEWMEYTRKNSGKQSSIWRRTNVNNYCLTYWAITGSKSAQQRTQLNLYFDARRNQLMSEEFNETVTSNHRKWHQNQLLRSYR